MGRHIRNAPPFGVSLSGVPLGFVVTAETKRGGVYQAEAAVLEAVAEFEYLESYGALQSQLSLRNPGDTVIESIRVVPFVLTFDGAPEAGIPRTRHMSGSWHFDGVYPPRAFRVLEESFLTHDTTKPLVIGGRNSGEHVPILQYALDTNDMLAGFSVGFEWSAGWQFSVGWERDSYLGESRPGLTIEGSMNLGPNGVIAIGPGETVKVPRVHVVFFAASSWQDLDNRQRRYYQEHLAAGLGNRVNIQPVAYNHWFGIYHDFDGDYLTRQSDRAAEVGCEYFCLDASWYKTVRNYRDGVGNWETPHPLKFPGGRKSVADLSDHVRGLGMGFGIWHMIQKAQPDSDAYRLRPSCFRRTETPADTLEGIEGVLRLGTEEGVTYALELLRRMIVDWQVSWMRYESAPEDGLAYNEGYNAVIDTLRAEFPGLFLEICSGGGQRLDLGSLVRTHGNWLSDHTADPDVCRFTQSGALRFWPAGYLALAVTAVKGRGRVSATSHEMVSRMLGTLYFSGAISEWTKDETGTARKHVEVFKDIRPLKNQPVFFPLPQPRRVEEWDIVVFGDGSGEAQLVFAFRMKGPDSVCTSIPHAPGRWKQLIGSHQATIRETRRNTEICLPRNGSALWIR